MYGFVILGQNLDNEKIIDEKEMKNITHFH